MGSFKNCQDSIKGADKGPSKSPGMVCLNLPETKFL